MKHTKDTLSKLRTQWIDSLEKSVRTTMFYQVKEKLRTNFEEVNFGEGALMVSLVFQKLML